MDEADRLSRTESLITVFLVVIFRHQRGVKSSSWKSDSAASGRTLGLYLGYVIRSTAQSRVVYINVHMLWKQPLTIVHTRAQDKTFEQESTDCLFKHKVQPIPSHQRTTNNDQR